MKSVWYVYVLFWWNFVISSNTDDFGKPFSMISKMQTECELAALTIGTILADHYNSFDEATEWDVRIHEDFLTEHLGFSGWIQSGTWKSGGQTALKNHAPTLYKVIINHL